MKILFVCKHNRFRSKVAEAYFNKINKNKRIKAASAGIFSGFPVVKNVIKINKKFGINIKEGSRGLDEGEIYKVDLLIIVANDVPASLFKSKVKNIVIWKVHDITNQSDEKGIERISRLIIKKVDKLVKKLEKAQ
jgi:protein-tyrosine-phosphatase